MSESTAERASSIFLGTDDGKMDFDCFAVRRVIHGFARPLVLDRRISDLVRGALQNANNSAGMQRVIGVTTA